MTIKTNHLVSPFAEWVALQSAPQIDPAIADVLGRISMPPLDLDAVARQAKLDAMSADAIANASRRRPCGGTA
jgi:hypothetical protein